MNGVPRHRMRCPRGDTVHTQTATNVTRRPSHGIRLVEQGGEHPGASSPVVIGHRRVFAWGVRQSRIPGGDGPVKLVVSPSWQLTEVEGDRADVLLYIPDVAALEVPADVDAPPRLVGVSPHGSKA